MYFGDEETERLFNTPPDDQVGDLDEWARLYLAEKVHDGGRIMALQGDGLVDTFSYGTEAELREAWLNFCRTIEGGPVFYGEHCVFPLPNAMWAWTHPDPEDGEDEHTVLMDLFFTKDQAMEALYGSQEEEFEYWLLNGDAKWKLVTNNPEG